MVVKVYLRDYRSEDFRLGPEGTYLINWNNRNTYVDAITITNKNITSNNNHSNSGNEIYNVIKGIINISKDNTTTRPIPKKGAHRKKNPKLICMLK